MSMKSRCAISQFQTLVKAKIWYGKIVPLAPIELPVLNTWVLSKLLATTQPEQKVCAFAMVTSDSTKKAFAFTKTHALNQRSNSLHGRNGALALYHAVVAAKLPVQESVWVVQHVSVIRLKPKKVSVAINHAQRSNNVPTLLQTVMDLNKVLKIQSLARPKQSL
jgi:hypothetical protein